MTARSCGRLFAFCLALLGLAPAFSLAAEQVRFEKRQLTDRYYCDGIAAGDINSDGKLDVVAGPFWYEGPDFRDAHEFYPAEPLPPEPSPSNSMFSFVRDFSGDGRPDILVLGRVHKHQAFWYENPGDEDSLWKKHFVFERVRGESPTLVDVNKNGSPDLLTHWEGRWGFLTPVPKKPKRPWEFTPIGADEQWPQFYHGQGIGDVNGDGRLDVLINDGWYEQPKPRENLLDARNTLFVDWPFHPMRFSQDRGGAQMFVDDIDADGDADVISSLHAHEWGLAWFEQYKENGSIRFRQHRIMGDRSEEKKFGVAFSQPHALDLADIDGDGLKDIVTGKRMWAHGPKGDVEPNADPVLYWFQLTRSDKGEVRYVPHRIDAKSGVGVQVLALDVNGNKKTDILTVSKLGTFVFLQK